MWLRCASSNLSRRKKVSGQQTAGTWDKHSWQAVPARYSSHGTIMTNVSAGVVGTPTTSRSCAVTVALAAAAVMSDLVIPHEEKACNSRLECISFDDTGCIYMLIQLQHGLLGL